MRQWQNALTIAAVEQSSGLNKLKVQSLFGSLFTVTVTLAFNHVARSHPILETYQARCRSRKSNMPKRKQ